jgi:hypothetical protein
MKKEVQKVKETLATWFAEKKAGEKKTRFVKKPCSLVTNNDRKEPRDL